MTFEFNSRFFYDEEEIRRFAKWYYEHPSTFIKKGFPTVEKWNEQVEKIIDCDLDTGVRFYVHYDNPEDAAMFKLMWC